MLTVYLAGAIRDNHPEDVEWRELAIRRLAGLPVRILNPLAGKTFSPPTGRWQRGGQPSSAGLIVKLDFWSVDRSDIIFFNFRALADGYPMIGSLIEFGRATRVGAILLSLVPSGYVGHRNPGAFPDLHPFIKENSAQVFADLDAGLDFLASEVSLLSGSNPSFGGMVGEPR